MLAGRKSIAHARLSDWADQAEAWLRVEFSKKGLDFYTSWSVADKTISLQVFRSKHRNKEIAMSGKPELVFEVTEPANIFITPTTLTKIILIAG